MAAPPLFLALKLVNVAPRLLWAMHSFDHWHDPTEGARNTAAVFSHAARSVTQGRARQLRIAELPKKSD